MPLYRVYGSVTGSKYLGEYEADTAEEAREKALNEADVSLCHQCSGECENPTIEEVNVEEVEVEEKVKPKRKRSK